MRTRELARRQQRLDSLFDKVGTLTDLEVQAHWSRYLCVLVSGFIEVSIQEIYRQYARDRAGQNVANFVDGRLKDFRNPKMERILQTTRLFSVEWEQELRAFVEDGPLKDAIDSIVNNRNKIAHGDDVGITYVTVKQYYKNAVKVVEVIEEQCGF